MPGLVCAGSGQPYLLWASPTVLFRVRVLLPLHRVCPHTVASKVCGTASAVQGGFGGAGRRPVKRQASGSAPVCMYYNEGSCVYPNCKFLHVCSQVDLSLPVLAGWEGSEVLLSSTLVVFPGPCAGTPIDALLYISSLGYGKVSWLVLGVCLQSRMYVPICSPLSRSLPSSMMLAKESGKGYLLGPFQRVAFFRVPRQSHRSCISMLV